MKHSTDQIFFGIPIIMFDETNQVVFITDHPEVTTDQRDGDHALFQLNLENGERTQLTEKYFALGFGHITGRNTSRIY